MPVELPRGSAYCLAVTHVSEEPAMSRVVRAFSVVPVLLLGACASAPAPSSWEVDQQKVAAIDRAATLRGVKVIWISAPTKRVAPAPAAATPG